MSLDIVNMEARTIAAEVAAGSLGAAEVAAACRRCRCRAA
jgi:hypothetical protein